MPGEDDPHLPCLRQEAQPGGRTKRCAGLEAFGTDECPEKVDQQADSGDSNNNVFHGLEPPAGVSVENANCEECDGRGDEYEIRHCGRHSFLWARV